jgi:hypothetical protein
MPEWAIEGLISVLPCFGFPAERARALCSSFALDIDILTSIIRNIELTFAIAKDGEQVRFGKNA